MVSRREETAYKYPRTPSSAEYYFSFQNKENCRMPTATLSYLLKMGGTADKRPVNLSKDIWEYLLLKQITITAEYLPGTLNTRADW